MTAASEYTLTDAEYADLIEAGRPVLYLVAGGREPMSPHEAVNQVWQRIAATRGVAWDSIEPSTKGERVFLAVPR